MFLRFRAYHRCGDIDSWGPLMPRVNGVPHLHGALERRKEPRQPSLSKGVKSWRGMYDSLDKQFGEVQKRPKKKFDFRYGTKRPVPAYWW